MNNKVFVHVFLFYPPIPIIHKNPFTPFTARRWHGFLGEGHSSQGGSHVNNSA